MLSILIPVYKVEVQRFVKELCKSARLAKIDFEIIVADDGSGSDWDNSFNILRSLDNVHLLRFSTNQGRSKIRNLLAEHAKYDHLLFLDADGQLTDEHFILRYLDFINFDIVYGGRIYPKINSIKDSQKLHYLYGTQNESKNSNERNHDPFQYFHSNNFLVSKKIIKQIPFNENLLGYGYEDTLWAKEIENNKIIIKNIDNPVIHIGIEESTIFIEKTKQALINLYKINKKRIVIKNKLSITANILMKSKLHLLLIPIYNLFEKKIIENIYSKSPSLTIYQIFKLANYIKIFMQNEKKY